jgi:hypothetical protein
MLLNLSENHFFEGTGDLILALTVPFGWIRSPIVSFYERFDPFSPESGVSQLCNHTGKFGVEESILPKCLNCSNN